MESLLSLRLQGDDLRSFLSEGGCNCGQCSPQLDAIFLETMLRTQLRKVRGMKEDLAYYERCPAGHKDRSYAFLHAAALRYINQRRGEYNRQQVMQNLRGDGEPIQTVAAVKAAQQPEGLALPILEVRVKWVRSGVGLTLR